MDVGRLFHQAWSLYRRNFGWLLLAWLLTAAILTAAGLLVFATAAAIGISSLGGLHLSGFADLSGQGGVVSAVLVLGIGFLIVQLLAFVFFAGTIKMTIASGHSGRAARLGDLFAAFRQLPGLLGLWLLVAVVVPAGLGAFIVGLARVTVALGILAAVAAALVVIWIAVRWLYALPLLVDRRCGLMAALHGSHEMVRRSGWWATFASLLLLEIVMVCVYAIPSLVFTIWSRSILTSGLGLGFSNILPLLVGGSLLSVIALLAMPYPFCFLSSMYLQADAFSAPLPASRHCAYCGALLPLEASFCGVCGADVEAARTVIMPVAAPPTAGRPDTTGASQAKAEATRCAVCGSPLPAEASFCGVCGSRRATTLSCPNCQAEVSADDRFCPACGRTLSAGESTVQTRSLTLPLLPAAGSSTLRQPPVAESNVVPLPNSPARGIARRRAPILVLAIFIIVITAALAAGLFVLDDRHKTPSPATPSGAVAASPSSVAASASSSPVSSSPASSPLPSPTASSPSPRPDSVPVAVNSAVAALPAASGVAATLGTYFWAINTRHWQTVWQQYTLAYQRRVGSIDPLAKGDATSHDFNVVVHSLTLLSGDLAKAYVSFTSTQAARYGPNGDTRDTWTLDYTFRLVNGSWLIDANGAHNGSTHVPA